MFLATTALREYWDTGEQLLFLGPWCLQRKQGSSLNGLSYRVLGNPWDDQERFRRATDYLDACGERMLVRLSDYLNGVHGVSRTPRYWRVLIGPWLLDYLHVSYDRYIRIKEALRVEPELRTIVLDPQSFLVPGDTGEFFSWIDDDHYNLQVISEQLAHLGYRFPARKAEQGEEPRMAARRLAPPRAGLRQRLRRWGSSTLTHALRVSHGRRPGASLYEVRCPPWWLWRIAWRTGLHVLPHELSRQWSFWHHDPIFDERRKALAALSASDEFERITVQALPQHFPVLYLEGYATARNEALHGQRGFPAIMVSSTAWYSHEPFKFLAGEASEQGSRLVTVQHGGGYGIFRFIAPEQHESRLGDLGLVWGWADSKQAGRVRNAPDLLLSSQRTLKEGTHKRSASQTALFVLTAHLRYLPRFHSFPIGIDTEGYLDWQLRFLAAVSEEMRAKIRVRLYPAASEEAARAQLVERFAAVRFDNDEPLLRRMTRARMVIIDHCGTSILEALRLGVPLICFWDPERTDVREEAAPYVERLREAGILWDSPEAAAAKVEAVYEQPWAWWGQASVQSARREFVDRYALGRADWLTCWAKILTEEVGQGACDRFGGRPRIPTARQRGADALQPGEVDGLTVGRS